MGNICQDCLKKPQLIEPQKTSQILDVKDMLNGYDQNTPKTTGQQIQFSTAFLSIQTQSISNLYVDTLIIFTDQPKNVLKNRLIQNLGKSIVLELQQKIKKAYSKQIRNSKNEFSIKIDNPFVCLPIKKLVICELKVWDGSSQHNSYLKKRIDKQLNNATMLKNKVYMGIMEIQPFLGYSLRQFYKILMKKLKQYENKINEIVYISQNKNKNQLENQSFLGSNSQLSNISNYY